MSLNLQGVYLGVRVFNSKTSSPLTSEAVQPLQVPGLLLLHAELLPLVPVDFDRLLQGPQLGTEVTQRLVHRQTHPLAEAYLGLVKSY